MTQATMVSRGASTGAATAAANTAVNTASGYLRRSANATEAITASPMETVRSSDSGRAAAAGPPTKTTSCSVGPTRPYQIIAIAAASANPTSKARFRALGLG